MAAARLVRRRNTVSSVLTVIKAKNRIYRKRDTGMQALGLASPYLVFCLQEVMLEISTSLCVTADWPSRQEKE